MTAASPGVALAPQVHGRTWATPTPLHRRPPGSGHLLAGTGRSMGDLARSTLAARLARAYRRTGADLPGGDTRPTHGAQMEGWFWRFTDAARGQVVLALCGINQHPDGDWATVAVAAHPGTVVRAAAA